MPQPRRTTKQRQRLNPCFDPEHGLRVMREQCDTCIFKPGNRMHLNKGRLKEMIDTSWQNDTFVICHKTLPHGGGPKGTQQAVCRGSFDRVETTPIQLAKRLGMVGLYDLPEGAR